MSTRPRRATAARSWPCPPAPVRTTSLPWTLACSTTTASFPEPSFTLTPLWIVTCRISTRWDRLPSDGQPADTRDLDRGRPLTVVPWTPEIAIASASIPAVTVITFGASSPVTVTRPPSTATVTLPAG
jgi:hypothetical protein